MNKRILAIDGGGLRGVLAATIFEQTDAVADKPGHEIFRCLYRFTTGAILACRRARGVIASELTRFYVDNGAPVFGSYPFVKSSIIPFSLILLGVANAAESDVRVTLREAVTTRALAVEAVGVIEPLLQSMPIGVMARDPVSLHRRQLAWSVFFRGTLLKLGQMQSTTPLALHYNPLLDVAVIQGCNLGRGGLTQCTKLCAFPGETLAGTTPASVPSWFAGTDSDPLKRMSDLAASRVRSFARNYPVDSTNAVPWRKKYCSSALQSIAELRIAQGLLSMSKLQPERLGSGVRDYLRSSSGTGANPRKSQDAELHGLLENLSALSLSGAVALTDHGWLLFFTPKTTGWRQVALLVRPASKGNLRLESARIVSFTSETKP